MRVFSGAIFTETNTFSPLPTSIDSFRSAILYRGPAADTPPLTVLGSPWLVWRDMCEANGYTYLQGTIAFAEPAGLLTKETHFKLRDQILSELKQAMPVDFVVLLLHGSMMSEVSSDVEGDLLASVRTLVGASIPVGVLIDPHAHLTQKMVQYSDILAAFHEWPHDDVEERAVHVFQLCERIVRRQIKPFAERVDCQMVAAYPTRNQPMRAFVDSIKQMERSGEVLSASLVHGFPWGDHPDVGTQMLVCTDDDSDRAADIATRLGKQFFEMREAVTLRADFNIDEAFEHALSVPRGPIVLCDAGDNVPGGGAGDSTFMLERALDLKLNRLCFGPIWDPKSTSACFSAGEQSKLELEVGGKSGPASGKPVTVSARVMKLANGFDAGRPGNFGDRAWIRVGASDGANIDIVLHSRRATLTDPAVLTDLGIDIQKYKIFIGKMLMHGGTAFAPLASEVCSVASPGTLNMNYESLELKQVCRQWWPKWLNPRPGFLEVNS